MKRLLNNSNGKALLKILVILVLLLLGGWAFFYFTETPIEQAVEETIDIKMMDRTTGSTQEMQLEEQSAPTEEQPTEGY